MVKLVSQNYDTVGVFEDSFELVDSFKVVNFG